MSDITSGHSSYDGKPKRFQPSPSTAAPVLLRLPDATTYTIIIDSDFDRITEQAIEQVRNRRRWRKISSARQFIFEISGRYLADLGPDADSELKKIAKAGVVEIQIPINTGESAHAFPWEFALSEITAPFRSEQHLLVVRHLDCGAAPIAHAPTGMPVLIVQSAPGDLTDEYSFESEHRLIVSSFGGVDAYSLTDPTLNELQAMVSANPPGTIHFAGIDGLQGSEILKLADEQSSPGMFLADEQRRPVLVSPDLLSIAATCANTKPLLISYNFYNSSWPLASGAVRNGAGAAIGFQDEIDDAIAELFFARLYEAWQRSNWDLLTAYREAWKGLSAYKAKLRGTGIVLWSATSLISSLQTQAISASTSTGQTPEAILVPTDPRFLDVRDALQVVVDPCPKLNYSMLHNNRPLFNKFEIKRQVAGRLLNVSVQVELNTGVDIATYSTTFDLNRSRPIVDVSSLARVSLTSNMTRSLRESVYTSLSITVFWEDRLVCQETFRVALLPPDEWRDDDFNRVWLPSFVLPRDPVITKTVDKAQKYLRTLTDDSAVGFDGYQGVLASGAIEEKCLSVDQQVRSLWWGVIHEYGLSYINPPPTFTKRSQRLRTPTEVIEGGRGTCIDLTLLLAALLEYIDIYPVVFLLQGHAFPGYLRSEESYSRLRSVFLTPASVIGDDKEVKEDLRTQHEWVLSQRYYSSILQLVREGDIVPIESVALTQRLGFWHAVDQGAENLRSKTDFEFLVDIKSARDSDVTPIPLWSISQ